MVRLRLHVRAVLPIAAAITPFTAQASNAVPIEVARRGAGAAMVEPAPVLPLTALTGALTRLDRVADPQIDHATLQEWNRRAVRECARSGNRMVC